MDYEKKIESLQNKQAQLKAQEKKLIAQKKEAERKARTRRLIQIGAEAESVLGRPITSDDLPYFREFLLDDDCYFRRYMDYAKFSG